MNTNLKGSQVEIATKLTDSFLETFYKTFDPNVSQEYIESHLFPLYYDFFYDELELLKLDESHGNTND